MAPGRPSVRELVLSRSAGRDRVQDAVKAAALAMVLVGHLLAWTVARSGSTINSLEQAGWLAPLTWGLQILPLFFLLAGANLVASLGRSTDRADWYAARVLRLLSGPVPLLAITALLALGLGVVKPDIGRSAGLLPVQLVWFLGVYAVWTAAAPLLAAWRAWWAPLPWFAAVVGVDLLRIHVSERFGWINLLLVWGQFMLVGTHLDRLRRLPRWVPTVAAVGFVAAAVTLVRVGPYSAALITTKAAPGLSNLSPPSLVLCCAGLAQIGLLLALWPALDALLGRDGVWVPVAVFATRAMQVYLWHMLFVSLCIGAVIGIGLEADALTLAWWLTHVVVAVVAVGAVWCASPGLGRLADGTTALLARTWPLRVVRRVHGPVVPCAGLAVGGLVLLLVADSGMGDLLTYRTVVGVLPYQPLAALVLLATVVGFTARTRGSAVVTSHRR